MHQNALAAGASPQTPLGELTALPQTPSWKRLLRRHDSTDISLFFTNPPAKKIPGCATARNWQYLFRLILGPV